MALFRYLGMTLDGKEIQGEMEARDVHEVAVHLLDQGVSLEWCKKVNPDDPPENPPPEAAPAAEPAAETDDAVMEWIRKYSGDAIQTRFQAAAMAILLILIMGGTVWNAVYHLRPRFPISPPLQKKAKKHPAPRSGHLQAF